MRKNLLYFIVLLLWSGCLQLFAAIPAGYYDQAEGKKKEALKTALHHIIQYADVLSYGSGEGHTWWGFTKTDVRPEDGTVWDMYSDNRRNFNGYSAAAGMNIEHSFAKSWWGGAKRQAYMDLHHLNPSDQRANSSKGSWPMAIVDGKTSTDNGTIKVGKSNSRPGGEITAWEPHNDYKGDFARVYMYMVTCYEDYASDWTGNSVNQLDNNTYPVFEPWAVQLLLKWSREDPVSKKELDRNEAVYQIQGNRNPFIDYPELAEYIWGDRMDEPFYTQTVTEPILITPVEGTVIDAGLTGTNYGITGSVYVKGRNLKGNLTVALTGDYFTTPVTTLTKEEAEEGTNIAYTYLPRSAGRHTARLSLTGEEVRVTVTITGNAVNGIPALPASNITPTSFSANWIGLSGIEDVQLDVQTRNENDTEFTSVTGYPQVVPSAPGTWNVYDLNADTEYRYRLSSGGLQSDPVTLRTLPPIPLVHTELPDGEMEFTADQGVASESKRVTITGEYITENLQITTEEPFEIRTEQSDWSATAALPGTGGTVYVRLSAAASEGGQLGTLTISTPAIEEDEVIPLKGRVILEKDFLEDFEVGTKTSYAEKDVQCTAVNWKMSDALIGNSASDRKHGTKAVRLRNGFIRMNEDKAKGLGTLSFYAGVFGNDKSSPLTIAWSTDGGTGWTELEEHPQPDGSALQPFSYTLNIQGNVRIKISKADDTRINIDDIVMTDFDPSGIESFFTQPVKIYGGTHTLIIESAFDGNLQIYELSGKQIGHIRVQAGRTAIALPAGTYLVSSREFLIKGEKVTVK